MGRFAASDAAAQLLNLQAIIVGNLHPAGFVQAVKGTKAVGQRAGGVEGEALGNDAALGAVDLKPVQRDVFSVSSTIPQVKLAFMLPGYSRTAVVQVSIPSGENVPAAWMAVGAAPRTRWRKLRA